MHGEEVRILKHHNNDSLTHTCEQRKEYSADEPAPYYEKLTNVVSGTYTCTCVYIHVYTSLHTLQYL